MDPNAALEEIRLLQVQILERLNKGQYGGCLPDLAAELVDKIEGLDGWLTKGGFLPDAWARKCAECGGSGRGLINAFFAESPCATCRGKGKVTT